MEFVFLLIGVIVSLLVTYGTGRCLYDHKGVIRVLKESEEVRIAHLFMGTMLTIVTFIALCAINNTFWHLPYLTV